MGSCLAKQPIRLDAVDLLDAEGDIVQNINKDQHIEFYRQKIATILEPLKKKPLSKKKTLEVFAVADPKENQKYVASLNEALRENSVTAKNVLTTLMDYAHPSDQENIKQQFPESDRLSALKCFIFLYTGNFTYKRMGTQLRKSQFDKIVKVIATVKTQLALYNKDVYARPLKPQPNGQYLDLYRCIDKPDKHMTPGARMYWKGFTSTSLSRNVAGQFGNYMYTIDLDDKRPHEYILIPKKLSQYDEEEILLFPYFHWEYVEAKVFQNGASYQIKQCQPKSD